MKSLLQILFFFLAAPCFAQPTGHQKIFFEITDNGDTLDFKNNFKRIDFDRNTILKFKNYQILDISQNKTGFGYYPQSYFFHKTLMTDDHHIQIVKNKSDTMSIEILNAFDRYFISIPFQKGNFRMYVNDGKEFNWLSNTLPYKTVYSGTDVYNISPADWNAFKVSILKRPKDYFISEQFEKQQLLEKPVLPEDDPNFKNPRRINNLRIEVADFNFDGEKDYREHKLNDNERWNYFIYIDPINRFVLDTVLSNMDISYFDFDKKTFTVEETKKYKSDINLAGTYQFVNGKPTLLSEKSLTGGFAEEKPPSDLDKKANTIETYQVQHFKFIFEKNTPGIDIPPIVGFYANKISVFDSLTNKLIYSIVAVGNKVKEAEGCSDSLQIADYNFDGFPDFRICNNGMAGKHIYYLFHPKSNSFIIEKTLTELINLTFDFEQKIAKGSTEKKELLGYPAAHPKRYYTEQLLFEGIALQNLTVTTSDHLNTAGTTEKAKYLNQKRIYEGDSIGLKLLNQAPLIKKVGEFKFEIRFNPEEYKPSGEKDSYIRILTISNNKKKWGPYAIEGNYLREVPHWLDSLEIADFNFDGYPDVRLYNSQINNGQHSYFIYNPEKEVQAYYIETLFSFSQNVEFIPSEKIMKGTILEANQTVYFFLKNDTLTLTKQDKDLTKPPFIEECIYRYGNRRALRSAYGSLEPVLKKEYGDFNFDGFEDFRIQSTKGPYMWDVFIYYPKKEIYVKDTLLSKFAHFDYNKLEKTLQGYYTIREDETTRVTYYYRWSFAEKKMVLYQEQVCDSKFPGAESNKCTISRLVDGKWIEIEQFGAE